MLYGRMSGHKDSTHFMVQLYLDATRLKGWDACPVVDSDILFIRL
jgi:hypothetical protein